MELLCLSLVVVNKLLLYDFPFFKFPNKMWKNTAMQPPTDL